MASGFHVLGVRREDKNKWERRVPLTPDHVRQLTGEGIRVIIQPSKLRIFPDDAYRDAGAELCEDLSPASVILAVKEVPIPLLLPGKTYLFFSHTIKAQPKNMPLLDALLERRIRLIDYECITIGGQRGGKRLVAFGRYAGLAGMIDFLRGLGERFLSMGFSTPFLNIAAMYMYPNIARALQAVEDCGEAIRQYGLPDEVCPFTVAVTGSGNVAQGALEVLEKLPIRHVDPFDFEGIVAAASGKDKTHTIYVAVAKDRHLVRKRTAGEQLPSIVSSTSMGDLSSLDSRTSSPVASMKSPVLSPVAAAQFARAAADAPFDTADYRKHPDNYAPHFHVTVLPFTSVIVNCMYWEDCYPRVVTVRQARDLHFAGRLRVLGVCDISCDLNGSIEFLEEFTSIEQPFYVYDVAAKRVLHDMSAPGILYHAVDHLPSECPRDASAHFGSCLLPFMPALLCSDAAKSPDAPDSGLPAELSGAIVCWEGKLAPNFYYIAELRATAERARHSRDRRPSVSGRSLVVELEGHLFDNHFVGRVLDIIEDSGSDVSAQIIHCRVGKDRFTPTQMRMQLDVPDTRHSAGSRLSAVVSSIMALAQSLSIDVAVLEMGAEGSPAPAPFALAEASSATELPGLSLDEEPATVPRPTVCIGATAVVPAIVPGGQRRILVLGAGFVSAPLVEYMLRRPENLLTVTSVALSEAERLAAGRQRCTPLQLDVFKDDAAVGALVATHDIVVSLVPAPCHPAVARHAIAHRRHMVTASYISPEMAALDGAAKAAGIVIVNEAGLDPGIDHMSAMALMDGAKARGGVITSFSSVCGGLPAPEAANNPLGYKFSWSPRGALVATRNAGCYLSDGAIVRVSGSDLLSSVQRFYLNPAFALEMIPNRDSLPYGDKYHIAGPALRSMSRGTLRYAGFCAHMAALTALGFLNTVEEPLPSPLTTRGWLAHAVSLDRVHAADDDALFSATVAFVAAAARASVAAYTAQLDATAPSLASRARLAAATCTNENLDNDLSRREEFARFLRWCGFFSNAVLPTAGCGVHSGSHVPIDTLVSLLTALPETSYASGERDMVIMQHSIEAAFPDGHSERYTASMVEYAHANGQTAMARTVGLTAGVATQLVLDGEGGSERGVIVPLAPEWYTPMLAALKGEGIALHETMAVL